MHKRTLIFQLKSQHCQKEMLMFWLRMLHKRTRISQLKSQQCKKELSLFWLRNQMLHKRKTEKPNISNLIADKDANDSNCEQMHQKERPNITKKEATAEKEEKKETE